MDNYIAEIIKEYLTKRYPAETEAKIRSWLVDEENVEEKNEALSAYWELLHVDPDIFVYESLEQVKEQIGRRSQIITPESVTREINSDDKENIDYPSDISPAPIKEELLPIVSQQPEVEPEETNNTPSVIMLSPADVVEIPTYEVPATPIVTKQNNVESEPAEPKLVQPAVIHLKQPEAVEPIQENIVFVKPVVEVKKETILFPDETESEEKERNTFYWGKIVAVLIPFLFILMGAWFYFNQQPSTGAMVSLSVPYGEIKQVELSDGSVVWLNAGSTLSYPQEFRGEQRKVELSGEAFFSVAQDSKKPFKVETASFRIEVIGTEFNVVAYPDEENAKATLTSGKIKIETVAKEVYELAPAQQLSYNVKTAETMIRTVELKGNPDWKEGTIVFEDVSLKEILKILERQLNIHCEADDALLVSDDTYTMTFVKNEGRECIEYILEVLQEMIDFSWKEENNIWYLTKK